MEPASLLEQILSRWRGHVPEDIAEFEVDEFLRGYRPAMLVDVRSIVSLRAPAPAPAPLLTGPHAVSLDSVLAPWKPRRRTSVQPAVRTLAAASRERTFYWLGTPTDLQLAATVRIEGKVNERARGHLERVKTALRAGYKPKTVRIGSQQGFVLERAGQVLTPAGAEALVSGLFERPQIQATGDHDRDFAAHRLADARWIARWMSTLPLSTLESPAALTNKLNHSELGRYFTLRRGHAGRLVLQNHEQDGSEGSGNFFAPEGHDTYPDLFRMLVHLAAGDPEQHWAVQGRAADAAAVASKAAGKSLHDVLADAGFMTKDGVGKETTRSEPATLLDRFGAQAAPAPPAPAPQRLEAERRAAEIFDRMAELFPARDGAVDSDALTSVQFALEDLEAVPVRHISVDPESWGTRDDAWYEEATWHYERELVKPADLPALLGVDWSPEMTADLLSAFLYESVRFGGSVPDWLFRQQIADTIYPDPRYGRLELQVVPKDTAFAFVKQHHSTLGGSAKLPPGIQYALGPGRREAFRRPELVAVALAGHPTGRWSGRPGQACGPQEILELHRVASIGGLHTLNRRGERVPLNAASMLTSRIMDLLPTSARTDHPGCLLVTYSLVSERGTPYLALVSKGLRPVARIQGKAAGGARSGSSGTARNEDDKIRWEYGPAANAPTWDVLQGVVDADRIEGAKAAFATYGKRTTA